MKGMHRLSPLILAIAIFEFARVDADAQSFHLTINAVEDVVKVGGKIRLKIQLKNTSDDEIFLYSGPCGQAGNITTIQNFRPVVKDAQGKQPPLTRLGREIFRRPNPGETFPDVVIECSGGFYPLAVGQVQNAEIVLSDFYDLNVPGSYTVEVVCRPSTGIGVPLEHLGGKKENKQIVTPKFVTITVVDQ